ncbi:MAG: YqiA/YcfP family alpha/beta fold hydrolase [Bacteroidales bacterium]
MRTIYIHGLDSHPFPEKNKIMKQAGLEVTALHINYREKLGVYETLKDTVIRKKIEFIIGSSLGGYLGNTLAEDLGLPCLLFNPAMHYTDVFYSKIPVIKKPLCPSRYVVLGENDATINPNYTLKVFREKEKKCASQRIITCHWLGHEIDLQTFEEMVHWALYPIMPTK